jgi:hypothetical protein
MKYIIIIILILIIIIFFLIQKKKQIEYKEKYTSMECDFNCGKYKNDEECLSCKNCGLCSLTDNKGKKIKQCLPGTKKGSFFNNLCSGNSWSYYDDKKRKELEEQKMANIVLTKVKEEIVQEEINAYDRILSAMGQNLRGIYSDIKPTQIFEGDLTLNKSEVSVTDNNREKEEKEQEKLEAMKPLFKPSDPILPPVIASTSKPKKEPITYDEVLLELESLSSF